MHGIRRKFYKLNSKIREIIAPGLKNSQYCYKDILNAYVRRNSRWLDLGCGHQILPEWMPLSEEEQSTMVKRCKMVIGIDYDYLSLQRHKHLRYGIVGDMQNLPFKDNSFNIITANMVIEHLKNPNIALAEVHRILEQNGLFVFHTPNILSYATLFTFIIPKWIKNKLIKFLEGRKEEDIFPVYYRMNSSRTLKNLAQVNGFDIHQLNLVESSANTTMLGPVVIIELLIIRILRLKVFANLRSNIIAVLYKKRIVALPNSG